VKDEKVFGMTILFLNLQDFLQAAQGYFIPGISIQASADNEKITLTIIQTQN